MRHSTAKDLEPRVIERIAARLAELEALAKAANTEDEGSWVAQPNDVIGGWCVTPTSLSPAYGGHEVADFCSQETARFIAALSPSAVLTFTAGLRDVLALHRPVVDAHRASEDKGCRECNEWGWPCPTVQALASALGVEGESE